MTVGRPGPQRPEKHNRIQIPQENTLAQFVTKAVSVIKTFFSYLQRASAFLYTSLKSLPSYLIRRAEPNATLNSAQHNDANIKNIDNPSNIAPSQHASINKADAAKRFAEEQEKLKQAKPLVEFPINENQKAFLALKNILSCCNEQLRQEIFQDMGMLANTYDYIREFLNLSESERAKLSISDNNAEQIGKIVKQFRVIKNHLRGNPKQFNQKQILAQMAAANVWLSGLLTNSTPYKLTDDLGAGSFGVVMVAERIDTAGESGAPFKTVLKITCPSLKDDDERTVHLKNVVRDHRFVSSEGLALSYDLKDEVTPSVHGIISYNPKTQAFRIYQGESIDCEEDEIIYAVINSYNPDACDSLTFFLQDHSTQFIKPFGKRLFTNLNEFHKTGIAHKDIKPDNLLAKREAFNVISCQLIDLGGSTTITNPSDEEYPGNRIFTKAYASPEVLNYYENDKPAYNLYAADVWSAGLSILYLLETSTVNDLRHHHRMGVQLLIKFRDEGYCTSDWKFTHFLKHEANSHGEFSDYAKNVLQLIDSQLDLEDLLDRIFVPEAQRILATNAAAHPCWNVN